MRSVVLISAAVALAFACTPAAAQRGYKAAKTPDGVGYSSSPEPDGRVRVVYTGAKGTKPDDVAKFAMLRAAELTLAADKEWFAIIKAETRDLATDGASDLRDRTGPSLATGSASGSTGSVGPGGTPPGVSDPAVPGGPTTGGFGGGDVPYQLLERWRPSQSAQTTVVIQMGSGDEAQFPGLTQQPTIYSANDVIEQIRGKRN